jgi:6-pyruvoyl-tetrahydropterin synthase related domain
MNSNRTTINVNWPLLLCLAAAATFVIAPSFFRGNASGHDFQFHIESWMEVAQQWHQGILYPRWAEWSNFGFGEPRFIFYPPASWILGAALGSVLPWHMVPDAYIWLALLTAGFSMHQLAREWLARRDAIAAAVFFAVNPYNLMIVYYRSDFAELLAAAFFPLLVWFAILLAREGWRRVPQFACVFALIWLSNAPAAVIATYFVAAIILVYCILERSFRPILPGVIAGASGFALAAFYILPAAYEQPWVNISSVLVYNLQPWHNFLFTRAGDPEFILFNFKISAIALFIIGVFGISAVFAARQRFRGRTMFWILFVIGALPVILMFPATALLWRFVPEMQFVQFPWRTLTPLALVAAFFFAAAVSPLRRKWPAWIAAILALAAIAAWMTTNNWWDSQDTPGVARAISTDAGYDGTDEYVPAGCDRYDLPDNTPRVAALNPDADEPLSAPNFRLHVEAWQAERKFISVDSPQAMVLAVKLYPYPAWKATRNGEPIDFVTTPCTAPMQISLPAGHSDVVLRFTRTPDRTLGDAISLTTALVLLFFVYRKRRQ